MRTIPLPGGQVTLVDDDDHEWLRHFSWRLYDDGYVRYRVWMEEGRDRHIAIHRLIMEPCDPFLIDHRDRNPLNNQKHNLRLVTQSENLRNTAKQRGKSTSRYKGVSFDPWHAGSKKWRATIVIDRKKVTIGRYETPEEAARAYDEVAFRHFGELAYLNSHMESERPSAL